MGTVHTAFRLDAALLAKVEAEKERLTMELGFKVSNQDIVSRALRKYFKLAVHEKGGK